MSNFFQTNQAIPEEVKQIIKYASEDEVVEIMLQSLKMALENPDEMAKAMPQMPKAMIDSMKFFPKNDLTLRPMAKAMAKLLIQQVKHGKEPTPEEVTKAVSEAMFSSGAVPGGMPGGMPGLGALGGLAGMPGMASLPGMGALPGASAPSALPASNLEPEFAQQVERHISNGKNRLAEQEFDEAEKEFSIAVELLEEPQPDGELMFAALQHLSIAQLEQAEYLKAEPILKRWLRLGEKIYSPEHHLLAGAYLGLARVRESQQKMDDAELLYKRALSIAEKTGEQDAEALAATIDSVAYFYESRKRYNKADPLFERSYVLRKKIAGDGTLEVADFELEYSLVLNERGQNEQATDWCKRGVATKTKHLGEDDGEVIEANIHLGEIMFDAKDYAGAEAIARKAIAQLEPSGDEALPSAKELLIQVLQETGRDEEALALENELNSSAGGGCGS